MLTQSAHEPLPPVDERLVLWIPIYDDGASVKGTCCKHRIRTGPAVCECAEQLQAGAQLRENQAEHHRLLGRGLSVAVTAIFLWAKRTLHCARDE